VVTFVLSGVGDRETRNRFVEGVALAQASADRITLALKKPVWMEHFMAFVAEGPMKARIQSSKILLKNSGSRAVAGLLAQTCAWIVIAIMGFVGLCNILLCRFGGRD
jgi:hypothetical protein